MLEAGIFLSVQFCTKCTVLIGFAAVVIAIKFVQLNGKTLFCPNASI